MDGSFIQKYFFSALLILAFAAGIVLFWPFLKLIILAVIFSVLLHPVYRWLHGVVRIPRLAALLTLLSFVIILCVPVYFIGTIVLKQTHSMYAWLVAHGSITHITNNLSLYLHRLFPSLNFDVQGSINTAIAGLTTKLGSVFTTTITGVVYFILMLLAMFYFLKDGVSWKESLIKFSPLSLESNTTVIGMLKRSVIGIFRGYFVVGLAQGIVVGVGFYIFNIPHPALFGLIAACTSLVPGIGSSLVSVPTVLFLLIIGRTGAAVGYAVWAIGFSVAIDNVLNPYVIGKQIAIHPLLVLFSILGGIALMGPIGIIIGPLLTSFIYALTSVYKLEMAPEVVAE